MSLYLKYRPTDIAQVKGNREILDSIEGMLADPESCPHVFLLHGPTGCGKTTIGRIIATRLGVSGNDLNELDSADFRGIDTVREIRKNSQYMPLNGSYRVWILDECHKMTGDAQNALLKILEDTPSHVFFILCTTDPQKLLAAVKGRCSQFQVNTLNDLQMKRVLKEIVAGEGESLEREVYDQIIQDSQGHVRNAIQILEQVLNSPVEGRLKAAQQTTAQQSQSIDLCRTLLKPNATWKEVMVILSGLKDQDPESIRRMVLGYCQSVLLKADNTLAGLVMEEFMEPTYNSGFSQIIYACYSIIKNR